MKSLILKDLYNIGHNLRSMLLILVFFAFLFLAGQKSISSYLPVTSLLCAMMTVTTFSFDEMSSWTKYALILPVTRRTVVASKFAVLIIFSAAGTIFGLVCTLIFGIFLPSLNLYGSDALPVLSLTACLSFSLAVFMGSLSLPLLFRFGAEKARLLLFVSFAVPVALCIAIGKVLAFFGIPITDQVILRLIWLSPLAAFLTTAALFALSCRIFEKKEFT